MALGLSRAQQDQSLKILPPCFGCSAPTVEARSWLGEEGRDERIALGSPLLVS